LNQHSDARQFQTDHFDVLIIGAGLSGIGTAYHIKTMCPGKSFIILEGRDTIGGTWDLFRYPGIRSDSDMYTLGYSFRPWREGKAIADGASILSYVRETAREEGIESAIRFQHRVKRITWSSADGAWTVEAEHGPENMPVRFTCGFIVTCTGYYDYDGGYMPSFPGVDRFRGQLIHPQKWPEDLDYAGKRVVVIGSGATAVTLVPSLAEKAGHVTMLQRSPSYVVSRPAEDKLANRLRRLLPAKLAYGVTRWRNVLQAMFFYNIARWKPEETKKKLLEMVGKQLGASYDVGTHFTPSYKPWDQRVCLVPDGDLFKTIKAGKAEMVTDQIATFDEEGLTLVSGRRLAADIIVAATGLKLKLLGGISIVVDGKPVDLARTMTYKGMMYSGVPNLASAMGYTNASWTLKCDLTSVYVCRLIQHMDKHGYSACRPVRSDPSIAEMPLLDFTSGYVRRSIDSFPKQGTKTPWKLYQNYVLDYATLKFGAVDDGTMRFETPTKAAAHAA
jgi:cation diffusion facilitator CzcD-associated flavoprotein CzcO